MLETSRTPEYSRRRTDRNLNSSDMFVYKGARKFVGEMKERDKTTFEHQKRVASLAEKIAKEMNLGSKTIERVRLSASVHDTGKLEIPDDILNSPDRLDDEQFEIMKKHTQLSSVILKNSPLKNIAEITSSHHEKIDGSGYSGMRGDEIPLESRIIAVADVFDAMLSERPYKACLPLEDALIELRDSNKFDANVVSALREILIKVDYSPSQINSYYKEEDELGHA